jgi:signal transduction histidine kinase
MNLKNKTNRTIFWTSFTPWIILTCLVIVLLLAIIRIRNDKLQSITNISANYYYRLQGISDNTTTEPDNQELLKNIHGAIENLFDDKVYLLLLNNDYNYLASYPPGIPHYDSWTLKVNSFYKFHNLEITEVDSKKPINFSAAYCNVVNGQGDVVGYLMLLIQFSDFTNMIISYKWIILICLIVILISINIGARASWAHFIQDWTELLQALEEIKNGQMNSSLPLKSEHDIALIAGFIHELRLNNKELAATIAETKEQIHQLDMLKQRFISTVSHELRTPLVAIRSSLDLMLIKKKSTLDEESLKLIQLLSKNTAKLQKISENLLEALKSGDPSLAIKPERVLVANLIDEITGELNPFGQTYHILNQLPRTLFITYDRMKLTTVFSQILDNAFKYTPPNGKIVISGSDSGPNVILSIEDTGRGIPPEYRFAIFHQFFQVDENLGGQGLGLFIVKNIVEQAGGRVWVKSEVGKGSIFYVQIPKEPIIIENKSNLKKKALS